VNAYEYVSVLTILSAAEWRSKAQGLFVIFDFDGSQGLSREEVVILVMSVYGGVARVSGQGPPTVKTATALVEAAFREIRSLREVSLELLLEHVRNSELFPLISRNTIGEIRKPGSVLYGLYRGSRLTPVSTSFSRKSSHFSRMDYSPSLNTSVQDSLLSQSRRLSTRIGLSLPPPDHHSKGLIIVTDRQDGDRVAKRTITDLLRRYRNLQTLGTESSKAALYFPHVSKRNSDRVKREFAPESLQSFESFLRQIYPRATNTQMSILLKWAEGKRQRSPKRPHLRGEFFLLPRTSARKGRQ
jgi:hypothetical protein